MENNQRCPAETYVVLASTRQWSPSQTAGRNSTPSRNQNRGPSGLQVQTIANEARSAFAAELLLAWSMAAPGAPSTAAVHHLAETKSFGNRLATALFWGRPTLCHKLRASTALGNTTTMHHIWHNAPCNTWYNQ